MNIVKADPFNLVHMIRLAEMESYKKKEGTSGGFEQEEEKKEGEQQPLSVEDKEAIDAHTAQLIDLVFKYGTSKELKKKKKKGQTEEEKGNPKKKQLFTPSRKTKPKPGPKTLGYSAPSELWKDEPSGPYNLILKDFIPRDFCDIEKEEECFKNIKVVFQGGSFEEVKDLQSLSYSQAD
eukprot:CAMPEP_0170555584 /NCGR_PEP_ID=MMETSP0211-20121228/13478_1 /TAXON_ID=311385 /ORGANISM="Pseudokeronopsis sp., Strain OXSARD2" /LENGTH=178 /DNA_ID=CAMNT_0010865523 /DNA_START=148 /DNA_END=684 /DNA_ORIENTATION=+